jgi:hypothetical protein
LKENNEVPGCPKGEHDCMHRGKLVKENDIANELFIIKIISDFEKNRLEGEYLLEKSA